MFLQTRQWWKGYRIKGKDSETNSERLHHIALIFKNKAESNLKSVADRHWSDGALEADLRRADYIAKQRAMEDALMSLEVAENVDDRRKKQVKQDVISITHQRMKVKSLKTIFQTMEELVLKRCSLGSYWGLCVQHDTHAEIAGTRYESWSSFPPLPVEVVIAADLTRPDPA
ncbi:hypothetical protein L2E82_12276 [Cichorium intybus]|uniref:Uncharacterized protein n=1 Tax=Cichorium intybus TaxID=13427 RepID=A0ACB9GFT6_CICIN|nr:hypothetical protein L2E82_12276 [Cichorium intybus]